MVERVAVRESDSSDCPIPHHITPLLVDFSFGEVLQGAWFELCVDGVSLDGVLTGRFDQPDQTLQPCILGRSRPCACMISSCWTVPSMSSAPDNIPIEARWSPMFIRYALR